MLHDGVIGNVFNSSKAVMLVFKYRTVMCF